MFEKKELKYICLAIGFALVWFMLVLPYVSKNFEQSTSPIIQFLLFNVGLIIILNFVLKSTALNQPINFMNIFKWMFIVLAIDIIIPPYMVDFSGTLLTGPVLSLSAVDYVFGFIWASMGIGGFLLFIFTYVVSPGLLLLIAAALNKNFVRNL